MQKIQKFLIVIDLSIFALLIIFIIGFLAFDYEIFGIDKPIIQLPSVLKGYYEVLPWILFLLLVLDLIIKFKVSDYNFRYFLKKYWFDLLLTILIPILFPIKFLKPAVKIYKSTKLSKSGIKLFQKYDKIFRSENKS